MAKDKTGSAHAELMAALAKMSYEEVFATSVRAGIHRRDGTLMPQYDGEQRKGNALRERVREAGPLPTSILACSGPLSTSSEAGLTLAKEARELWAQEDDVNIDEARLTAIPGELADAVEQLATIIDSLTARLAVAEAALTVAIDDMRDMRSYVPEYFAAKHGHDNAIAKAQAVLKGDGDDQ